MINTFYGNDYFLDEASYIEKELKNFDLMIESLDIEAVNEGVIETFKNIGKTLFKALKWIWDKVTEFVKGAVNKYFDILDKIWAGKLNKYDVIDTTELLKQSNDFVRLLNDETNYMNTNLFQSVPKVSYKEFGEKIATYTLRIENIKAFFDNPYIDGLEFSKKSGFTYKDYIKDVKKVATTIGDESKDIEYVINKYQDIIKTRMNQLEPHVNKPRAVVGNMSVQDLYKIIKYFYDLMTVNTMTLKQFAIITIKPIKLKEDK